MMDGKPQRLSAKLNSDLDRIRKENAVLMEYQLESFRGDLNTIVKNAQHTISGDIRAFQQWNEMLWLQQRNTILGALMFRRWMLLSASSALILVLLGLTLLWSSLIAQSHQSRSLQGLGMQMHRDQRGTFLIPDPARIWATKCNQQGQEVVCFQMKE